MVVEDFRARAAGAGVTHRPEVVGFVFGFARLVADTDDFVLRQANGVAPDGVGLVVFVIDGDAEFFRRQTEDLRQQVPGERDGLFFEVVAEAEIAQHFKEGVVTRGVADVFQVVVFAASAYAALRGGGALVVARLAAGEDVLELHHARVGKEQGRVVARHQRGRVNDFVAVFGEVIEKGAPDVGGRSGSFMCHRGLLSLLAGCRRRKNRAGRGNAAGLPFL